MLKSTVNNSYVVLYLDSSEVINENTAEALVREMLASRHLAQWDKMYIDLFSSPRSTLLLARPERNIKVRLAEYALPFFGEYFTE